MDIDVKQKEYMFAMLGKYVHFACVQIAWLGESGERHQSIDKRATRTLSWSIVEAPRM